MNDKVAFYKQEIKKIAYNTAWMTTYEKPSKGLIGFYNQEHKCHLEVYVRTFRVNTCLRHPRSGYCTLFRRNVGFSDLKNIFLNPRTHTGKGFSKFSE